MEFGNKDDSWDPGLLLGRLQSFDLTDLEGQCEQSRMRSVEEDNVTSELYEALHWLASILAFLSTLTYITFIRTWHIKHAHIHFLVKEIWLVG